MGLDMYLSEKTYLSHYKPLREHGDHWAEEYEQADQILSITGLKSEVDGGIEVGVTVMYWRKANSIHQWFVENVQKGVDDCGNYYVSRDQLIELRDLAQKVLDNPSLGPDLLPTQGGFFFGNTDYDEWYLEDMKTTVEGLNKVLANANDAADFEYHSSW